MPHTTLSIDKTTYQKTAKRAKKEHLAVSAIARMLLKAYAEGRINIMPVQAELHYTEIKELPAKDITPEMQKQADKAYNMDEDKLINIPV